MMEAELTLELLCIYLSHCRASAQSPSQPPPAAGHDPQMALVGGTVIACEMFGSDLLEVQLLARNSGIVGSLVCLQLCGGGRLAAWDSSMGLHSVGMWGKREKSR